MQSAGPVILFQYFNIIISCLIIVLLINFRKKNFLNFGQDTTADRYKFFSFCRVHSDTPCYKNPTFVVTVIVTSFLTLHSLISSKPETLQSQSLPAIWMKLNINTILMFVTWEFRVFSLHTFISNFRDCLRRTWLGHRGRPVGCLSLSLSLCRRYSVVQVLLCVIEQTVQNINDSLPIKDRAGQQAIFSNILFQTDLYFHGNTVPIGPGLSNFWDFSYTQTHAHTHNFR